MNQLHDAVVVAYGRSAVAKSGKKGALRSAHPVDYAGQVLDGVLKKIPQLALDQIEDLIVGCAKPEGVQGFNMARVIAFRAGLGWDVPGQTVNRFCASGLQAISTAANMIMTGQAEIIAAGGVESMTAIPMGSDPSFRDKWVEEHEPGAYLPMGITAENVADQWNLSREDLDNFAYNSQLKAAEAIKNGSFKDEIVPVVIKNKKGDIIFDTDEGPRLSAPEVLAKLKPAFKKDGKVTAGNASAINDGAAALVIMSEDKAKELGITPMATWVAGALGGVDPSIMGVGPVAATRKVMAKTGLTVADMDLIEANEAFAAQSLAVAHDLEFDMSKVNVNGGAIALGHPVGASGARILVTLLYAMKHRGAKKGLATLCIGGGMGCATIVEMD